MSKKHLTLKQLYKSMPKIEVTPLKDEAIGEMVNAAMEMIWKQCVICKKNCKNYRGMKIHQGRKHKFALAMHKSLFNPGNVPYVTVHWDKDHV